MSFFSMSSMCGCQALPRERWESLLGVVSCLQALWQLFLWRWRGRKLWPESSLHWSEDPSHLSTALPCSQLPGFCKQKWYIQMHSIQRDHLHAECWRHVGSTVVMLLMYRRKNVGEMTPPCGTPSRIFTLLLKWPSSFILADLSCRKHRIHLYILPEPPLSSIFSRRPSCQTLSKAFSRSKKTTFFFSWKAFSIIWAMRASWSSVLLCFRYPVWVGDSLFRYSKNVDYSL